MCLAVPGKLMSIAGDDPAFRTGRVNFGGIVKQVNLAYVPEVKIGDYVLVHVGFALTMCFWHPETGSVYNLSLYLLWLRCFCCVDAESW